MHINDSCNLYLTKKGFYNDVLTIQEEYSFLLKYKNGIITIPYTIQKSF